DAARGPQPRRGRAPARDHDRRRQAARPPRRDEAPQGLRRRNGENRISIELRQRVLALAAMTPSPTRAATRRANGLALLTAATASVTIFVRAGGIRPAGRPVALVVATALQALAVAAGACALAVGRGARASGRSRRALVGLVVLVPLLLLAGKLVLTAGWADRIGPLVYRTGFRCLGLSIAIGAAPLPAFLWIWRLRDVPATGLHGAAPAVAAGAGAWAFVDAWCPLAEPAHLALGHVLPIALLIAAGFGWRRSRPPHRHG